MSTTTGLGSGSDFAGLNDILKQRYEPTLANCVVSDSEVYDLFTKVDHIPQEAIGGDGKQINIGHLFSGGGAAMFMGENGYFPDPAMPSAKQSNITVKQMGASAQVSGRVLRRMKDSAAAIADWAEQQLPAVVDRAVHHKDRALVGTGTGIIGRVNDASPAAGDLDIDSCFGIASLEGAINLVMEGDRLRAASDAAGSSLRTGVMTVTGQLFSTDKLIVDALATSLADNDYLALGTSVQTGFGSVEPMGLEGHVDDGTNVATYQGLSRTTYPKLKSFIRNLATADSGKLTESAVVALGVDIRRWGAGDPDTLLASYGAAMSFWKDMKADQIFNDPRGQFIGGTDLKSGLKVIVGGRALTIRGCRKVPDSRAYLLTRSALKLFTIGSGKWDDTTGSIWKQVVTTSGVQDAYFATFVEEFETAGLAPLRHGKFTNRTA